MQHGPSGQPAIAIGIRASNLPQWPSPRFPPSRLVRHLPSGCRRSAHCRCRGQVSHNPKQSEPFVARPASGHRVRGGGTSKTAVERKPSRLSSPELRPQDPIDFASEIKVPVLGLYSGIDAFVKQETIAKMRGLMNQGGSGSEIVVFPNVDHGFNADYRPSYDKAAATYAQKLASDWFKKHRV
ncbi:dienelactone hydrolase family protein [Hydrogenophaga sp. PBL-H3]|nr:dienelactone hydrolase family protein [Hydrogenophaga sp. PBL-H3]QHE80103.1 dienelactone hydrolase family protein [Hydrogenophaga sp. PBL-H3]